jgi:DnaJ-class molecular chaperone
MPRRDGGGKGDFFVRVKVVLPERLSDSERTLFEQLKKSRAAAAAA